MKAYKLTSKDGFTKGSTKWGEGVSHTAIGNGEKLCSSGWIHFYTDPLLAAFVNSAHVNFFNPQLWECETEGEVLHEPLKSGCKTLTTLRQIPLPNVTLVQRIAFAILCVKEIYDKDKPWTQWADDWLNNVNRTVGAAYAAGNAANAVAYAVAYAAAAYAAYAVWVANDSIASTYYSTVSVAAIAIYVDSYTIDFIEIAKKALTYS